MGNGRRWGGSGRVFGRLAHGVAGTRGRFSARPKCCSEAARGLGLARRTSRTKMIIVHFFSVQTVKCGHLEVPSHAMPVELETGVTVPQVIELQFETAASSESGNDSSPSLEMSSESGNELPRALMPALIRRSPSAPGPSRGVAGRRPRPASTKMFEETSFI